MNYAIGGAEHYVTLMSRVSGLPIFPYDHEAKSMHLNDTFTRDEAVRSVLRMLETDPASTMPDGEYVDLAESGTYDPSIITSELLAKESKLPETSTQHLPASWRGGSITDKTLIFEYLPFSETHIRFLSENGFNFVRVFFGFDTLRYPDMPEDPWLVNMNELRQLDQLIAWGMEHDVHIQIAMNRLLDKKGKQVGAVVFDEYGRESDNFTELSAKDVAWDLSREYWVMLAKRYAGIPAKYLSFDLINEQQPTNKEEMQATKKHWPGIVEAVRAVNPDRPLLISFQGRPNMEWVEFAASDCHCAGRFLGQYRKHLF